MNLGLFTRELIRMIKESFKQILLITLVIGALLSASVFGVRWYRQYQEEQARLAMQEESESEESAEEAEDAAIQYFKIGHIDLMADETLQNFQVQPYLPSEMVDAMRTWSSERYFFNLRTDKEKPANEEEVIRPEEQDDKNPLRPIDNGAVESFNPLSDFLNLDTKLQENIQMHPDKKKAYITYEIDQESGSVRIVKADTGYNEFQVGISVDDTNEQFPEGFSMEDTDLMLMKLGMTPGNEQFGYIESFFNWDKGLEENEGQYDNKNFYIENPRVYSVLSDITSPSSTSSISMITIVASVLLGFFLAVILVFLKNLFRETIFYSFAYGWAEDDLYLHYDKNDTVKDMTYDILQSSADSIAVIAEQAVEEDLAKALTSQSSKDLVIYQSITDIPLQNSIEEIALLVKKGESTKSWYEKQRKHLRTFRDVAVKIVEI